MRSFCTAVMHTFCQSLIGCSRLLWHNECGLSLLADHVGAVQFLPSRKDNNACQAAAAINAIDSIVSIVAYHFLESLSLSAFSSSIHSSTISSSLYSSDVSSSSSIISSTRIKILEEFVVLMDAQAVQLMEPTTDQILEELDVSIMYRFLQSPIGYSRSVNTDTSNGSFRLQPMRKNSVRRLPQPRASAVDFPTRVCCFHRLPSASANSFSRRNVRGRTSAVDFSASE